MATVKTAIQIYDGMSPAFRAMNNAMGIVISSFETLQDVSGRAVDVQSLRTARDELAKAEAAFSGIDNAIQGAKTSQDTFNRSIQTGAGHADSLWNKLKGAAMALGGVAAVKQGIELTDNITQSRARLNLLVDDGGSVQELESKIFDSAQRSRASYLDTLNFVSQIGNRASDAFGSPDELIAFTETLNKMFAISGALPEEARGATIQLTQALGSGVLRGEEFNSVFEAAPNVMQAIASYTNQPIGKLREMAAEGQITADIVKNALFAAAEETNEKFEAMPMTIGQVFIKIKNNAVMAFQPLMEKISALFNAEPAQVFIDTVSQGLYQLAAIASNVFEGMVTAGQFVVDNWYWIGPVIMGIVAAMIAYKVAVALASAALWIHNAAETAGAVAKGVATGATFAETAAQYGLNAALYACPLVWIIGLILLLVVALYAAVAAVNKFQGTSISATGIIAGVFAVLGAHVLNSCAIPLYNGFASLANFFGNVFNNPVAAIQILFYDLAESVIGLFLNMAKAIESVINKIPGVKVDVTSGVENFLGEIQKASQRVKDESGWKEYVKKYDYIDYGDAWNSGYNWGAGVEKKVTDFFNPNNLVKDKEQPENPYDGISAPIYETADNTGAIKDSMELTHEDLKYLRDLAEREIINRFTTAEIRVEMTNNNQINSDLDVDGISEHLRTRVEAEMAAAAEGVHL